MNISTQINTLLQKNFGLRINRVGKPKKEMKPENGGNNNLIVEFLGPSGSGKTTVHDYYLNNYNINFKRKIWTRKDLKYLTVNKSAINNSVLNYSKIYNKIFPLRIEKVFKTYKGYAVNYNRIGGAFSVLQQDLIMNTALNNKIFFLDQLFYLYNKEYQKIADDKIHKWFLKDRVFIFCKASGEGLAKNIEKRAKYGRGLLPIHEGFNKNQLIEREKKVMKSKLKEANFLIEQDANILIINTGHSLEENSQKIDEFLFKYLKNKKSI